MRRRTSSCSAVRDGRRVGLLAKGNRALVERNSFSGLGGGGVELWNAPYEGLCASSYLIRDNVINDTNQLLRVAAPIWVEAFKAGGAVPCHADIAVHNNTIAAGPGATLAQGGELGVLVVALAVHLIGATGHGHRAQAAQGEGVGLAQGVELLVHQGVHPGQEHAGHPRPEWVQKRPTPVATGFGRF